MGGSDIKGGKIIMKWDRFCQILVEADQKFEQISLDLPQYRNYLKKSSLIISLGTIQIPFKKEPTVLDLMPWLRLLNDSDFKDNLICLNDTIERLEDDLKAMARQKKDGSIKGIAEKLARAQSELDSFPLQELEVHDSIDIQLIFPSVNIEAIQVMKKHRLTNKEKVCFCRACIRVFIH
jgi:hypothetical protein